MPLITESIYALDCLNLSELARFDTLWPNARYPEELAEAFPCGTMDVEFSFIPNWARSTGLVTETGALLFHNPYSLPYASMQLLPTDGGAIRCGIDALDADVLNID